jgi:hypothetical protein
LPFTRLFLPLALFVKVLAEIHYPANGRSRRGGYFNEVQAFLFGSAQRFPRRNNPDLAPILVYQANFRDSYPPVHPGPLFYDIELPPGWLWFVARETAALYTIL